MTWPLKNLLPGSTELYCYSLWSQHDFKLTLVAPRASKLGDYRFSKQTKSHQITLNRDLSPYTLLLVYLHEVAHYCTFNIHGAGVKPHGSEWQGQMRQLTTPLLEDQQLPLTLREALREHLVRPTATTCSSPQLLKELRKYHPPSHERPLAELASGQEFVFRKTRYRKLSLRRTRVSCQRLKDNALYLIPNLALVSPCVK